MGHAFSSLDELGEGYGFRKIRKPLGVKAFGVNATVYPPAYEGFFHYHDTQDELYFVHSGEARVIVEGEERPLRQWDFVHCPVGTKHTIVGAGDGPCVVIAVGAREHADSPDWGGYTVDDTALRHRAGVEEETTKALEAYAPVPKRTPTRYRDGWLPD